MSGSKSKVNHLEATFANAWLKEHELADGGYIAKESDSDPIIFRWGIGVLTLLISIDTLSMKGSFVDYASIPILGPIKVAASEVSGSLTDGIVARRDGRLIAGTITLYAKDQFVRLKVSANVLGSTYNKDIRLLAIPADGSDEITFILAKSFKPEVL